MNLKMQIRHSPSRVWYFALTFWLSRKGGEPFDFKQLLREQLHCVGGKRIVTKVTSNTYSARLWFICIPPFSVLKYCESW